MKMKTLFSFGMMLSLISSAQPVQFKLDLPPSYMAVPHSLYSLMPARDGNLLIATGALAMPPINIYNNEQRLVMGKISPAGAVHWLNEYRYLPHFCYPGAIIELPDSGIMVACEVPPHLVIFKIDKDGNVLFSNLYTPSTIWTPNMEAFAPKTFLQKNDSVLFLAGTIWSTYLKEAGYIELDLNGNIIGSHFFQHRGLSTTLSNIISCSDSTWLLSTLIEQEAVQRYTVGLIKLNSSGTVLWSYDYDDGVHDFLNNPTRSSVIELGNDGFIVAAGFGMNSLQPGTALFKTDKYGILDWSFTIEPALRDEQLHVLGNSNFLLTATQELSGPANQITLELTKDGDLVQARTLNPTTFPLAWGSSSYIQDGFLNTATLNSTWESILFTHRDLSGSLICNESLLNFSKDTLVLFDSSGVIESTTSLLQSVINVTKISYPGITALECGTVGITEELNQFLNLFPNPASNQLVVGSNQHMQGRIMIFDSNGKAVWTGDEKIPAAVDISQLAEGIYAVVLTAGEHYQKAIFTKVN